MQDRNDASSARSPAEHNEAHNHKVCGFNQYPFLLKRYNAQPYPSSGRHEHVHRQRSRRPRVAPRVTWSVALRVDRRITLIHQAADTSTCTASAAAGPESRLESPPLSLFSSSPWPLTSAFVRFEHDER